MKKYTIVIITVIGIILGFFTGLYLYKIDEIEENNKLELSKINNNVNIETEDISENKTNKLITTNSKEEKTSPNCVIKLKVYYRKCEHLIEKKQKIEDVYVNITKEEIAKRFSDWELQTFTPTEITLYKDIDEFCNEHYLLKENDGYITVFKLDENNNIKFYDSTDISVEYLSEDDQKRIQEGIKVYTKKELNKTLEDFE